MQSQRRIKKANTSDPSKIRKMIPNAIALMAIVAVVGICLIPLFTGNYKGHGQDPNWDKTHTTITSIDEAVKLFGGDLLLDKLELKQNSPKPYTEFILEYADQKGKNINDRKTWSMLSAQVLYGGKQFDVDDDYANLTIFFRDNDPSIVGSEKDPGYESLLGKSKAAKVINGITVKYRAYQENAFRYCFCAEFKHLGYVYFLESYSKTNSNLSWDTLNQMLSSPDSL
ncbi:hypothetical protein EQM14_15585 [Caproiciproducens sp. NJN-50]|uniref:hypothetical protein n=1 Tax=Acutalibacteraceae TaxID=3082771 RepID=UPI000FFE24F8|nr:MULTISPECIES: hypothetical protein [Acutalibacteraceae]QAT51076.1 hypothetical protein EQM14_15585 [Caproiciproducens sp. NJN-50]